MADQESARDIPTAVREVCSWLPEAREKKTHGMPTFHVRGKNFGIFSVNHHGSGQVALWLNAPVLGSYEHFALKRMLRALPQDTP